MSTQTAPLKNRILGGLPELERERLFPKLTPVELHLGQVLFTPGEVMKFVYFPNNSMVSLVSSTSSGESVEVGVVGFEGVAGISAVLGVDQSPYQALVQYPNGAMRLSVDDLREEFGRNGALHSQLLRYAQTLLLQTSQIAACNRLHTVSERLARWLLMSQDRCQCEDLPFTHEFLSLMLGTRRPSVTEAALILQTEGCIHYRRGNIKIIDRDTLLEHTCDCYEVVKTEFDSMIASLPRQTGSV
jgi:CRP-like cAMP-binding protein